MPVVCTAPCAAAAAAAAAAVSVATESRAVVATMVIVVAMVMVVAMVAESTFLWSPRIVFTAAAEAASPKNAHRTHTRIHLRTRELYIYIFHLFDFTRMRFSIALDALLSLVDEI